MEMVQPRWRIAGLAAALLFILMVVQDAGAAVGSAGAMPGGRSDLIPIDGLRIYGRLERAAVMFPHDLHTDALESLGMGCQRCHPSEDLRLSVKFGRWENTGRNAVMDVYHSDCITCHRELTAQGIDSGPLTCGQCHRRPAELVSVREPMGFDKSLHYRHVKSQENACQNCHHAYDGDQKKLFYDQGKEGSCRYCHGEVSEENRISFRLAAHTDCLECHRKALAAEKPTGPILCRGCHDAGERKRIKSVDPVPRLERKQPDVVFVKNAIASDGQVQVTAARMQPTAFDHRGHEESNSTCRVCHHSSMDACAQCHTTSGSDEGRQVKLEQAMHQADASQSCVGCHRREQRQKSCVGCHAFIQPQRPPDAEGCGVCHIEPPVDASAGGAGETAGPNPQTTLDNRTLANVAWEDADIPEQVVIKTMSQEYQPVTLPHRKIVRSLAANVGDNKLAAYFHRQTYTLCQGCHHHGPAVKKPPACASCHGQPFAENRLHMPGLLGAYHGQCLGCHAEMGLTKPDTTNCTTCHAAKK